MSTPELDVENINKLIRFWRKERDESTNDGDRHTAACYVDAFQTVRINHGLELLSEENNPDRELAE